MLLSACGEPPDIAVQHVSMNLTDSSTGFSLELLDRLLAAPDAGNVFISPLSATLALSMAASAAHGDTRTAFLKTLGLDPNVDPSTEARQTIDRLLQSDAHAQLELAQAVWADKGLTLNHAYVAKLRIDYRAQLANLDFTSPDAPGVVNRWVDNATHHKIPQLVDSFDPSTVAYLVNATYFHALWATEFQSQDPVDFHTFSGATVRVPMMKRDESVTELWTPGFVAELLPYKGGRYSMVLLLPGKVLAPASFTGLLTKTNWGDVLGFLHNSVGPSLGGPCKPWDGGSLGLAPDAHVICDGSLVMPKFKLDFGTELLPQLVAMGMPVGDLSDICSGCFISSVVQKTHLEVDEKGTVAAAATGATVETALRIPTIIDRPFALAVIDNATDAPLFLGAIGQV
ncbi:MAG: serpin family protein [Candidatus Dormibacteraceae bacterium]